MKTNGEDAYSFTPMITLYYIPNTNDQSKKIANMDWLLKHYYKYSKINSTFKYIVFDHAWAAISHGGGIEIRL